MRLGFTYDNLLLDLQEVSNVVNDSLVTEDLKNIIFEVKESDVTLIGATPLITFKKPVTMEAYSLIDFDKDGEGITEIYMQIKAKELLDFLGSYKNLKLTRVSEVVFEFTERKQIKCTVIEEEIISGESFDKPRTFMSCWIFDNIPIKPNVMPYIKMQIPNKNEMIDFEVASLKMHTSNLIPITQAGTNMYSYLSFDEDLVFVFHSSFTTFMKNRLQEEKGIFTGLKLSYRAATFIDKVVCFVEDEFVKITKDEGYLYFLTSEGETYIRYDNHIAEYKAYINMFKKDNGIVLNRFYLKDVLRRLSLTNDAIEFIIHPQDGYVTVRNSKFTQDIQLTNVKGFEGKETLTFKIMPEVLNKAVIMDNVANEYFNNRDSIVDGSQIIDEDLFLYCNVYDAKGNYAVVFTDKSRYGDGNAWYSILRAKVY